MSPAFVIALLGGTCAAALAVSVAVHAGRSMARWSFVAGMLVLASESTLTALGVATTDLARVEHWQQWRLLAGSLVPVTWLLFSLTYARDRERRFRSQPLILLGAAALLPGLAFYFREEAFVATFRFGGFVAEPADIHLRWSGLLLVGLGLLGAIGVVTNFERTFRAAVGTMRWRIKFLLLGAGTIFVARIYTGSQMLVFQASGSSLDSINAGALIVATPLLLRSFFRAGHFDLAVYPSHTALQRSLTLLVAGVYLVLIGALAKLVTYLGGDAAFALKAFLVLVGLVGLTLALQSDQARQRLAQFVSRHFQRPVYDYRTVWKKAIEATTSRTDPEELARSIATRLTETFRALSVSVWITQEKDRTLRLAASTSQHDAGNAPCANREIAGAEVLAHFRAQPDAIDFETSAAPWATVLRAAHPAQFANGGHRCGVPLLGRGEVLGVIAIGDRVGAAPWSVQDLEMIKCIADHTAACLMNLQLSQRLLDAREFEAFQTMATFFVHDLKNAAATLSLMLQNLPVHFDNPDFRADALRGVGKAVAHVNRLIGRLSQLRHEAKTELASADLNEVVTQALALCPLPAHTTLVRSARPLPPMLLDREQLAKVVANLVINAGEALASGGQVRVATAEHDGWVTLTVSDNGCGISRDFIAHSLFRPFQTTKPTGLGIGMFQSKMIVEAHGGRITLTSEVGKGTTFQVLLPVRQTPSDSTRPESLATSEPRHEAEAIAR